MIPSEKNNNGEIEQLKKTDVFGYTSSDSLIVWWLKRNESKKAYLCFTTYTSTKHHTQIDLPHFIFVALHDLFDPKSEKNRLTTRYSTQVEGLPSKLSTGLVVFEAVNQEDISYLHQSRAALYITPLRLQRSRLYWNRDTKGICFCFRFCIAPV